MALQWLAPGVYNNPPAVGPGTFERKDSAMGPQHLSKRRNQSTYAFTKGPFGLENDGKPLKKELLSLSLGVKRARGPSSAGHPAATT